MYAASKDYPQQLEELFPNDGQSFTLHGRVDAARKLLAVDETLRNTKGKKKSKKDVDESKPPSPLWDNIRSIVNGKTKKKDNGDDDETKAKLTPWATSYFVAPAHVRQKRVDKDTGKTNFMTTFFICPVGVGKSRFMAASVAKMKVPRWLTTIMLDNFLDQDTYLLATQQQNQLPLEVSDIRDMIKEGKVKKKNAADDDIITDIVSSKRAMTTRKKNLFMPSPTDKFGSRLERFWDATMTRVPNRIPNLLKLDNSGAFLPANMPTRFDVLNRETQHLQHSRDAQDTVRTCKKIAKICKYVFTALVCSKLYLTSIAAVVGGGVTSPASMSPALSWMIKMNSILKLSLVFPTLLLTGLVGKLAEKLRLEYYFKYTDDLRQRDMDNIPKKVWIDK